MGVGLAFDLVPALESQEAAIPTGTVHIKLTAIDASSQQFVNRREQVVIVGKQDRNTWFVIVSRQSDQVHHDLGVDFFLHGPRAFVLGRIPLLFLLTQRLNDREFWRKQGG